MGIGIAFRSLAFTPAERTPATKARFIILGALCVSLPTRTDDPLGRKDANAAPNFAANSGVSSKFESPVTLDSSNRLLFHLSPHIRLEETIAPGSTSLLGQILTPSLSVAPLPIEQFSETTTPCSIFTSFPNLKLENIKITYISEF